jgi:hypothetical protein
VSGRCEVVGVWPRTELAGEREVSQRASARRARIDMSRQLREEVTKEPYPAQRGSSCTGESNGSRQAAVAERWAMAIQRMELTRSPIAAVLMVQQTRVQPVGEQKAEVAAARSETLSLVLEHAIEMRNTRKGLVRIKSWMASRTRRSQGNAAQAE